MARSPLKRFNQGFPGLEGRFSQGFGNRFEQGFPSQEVQNNRFTQQQLPPVFTGSAQQPFQAQQPPQIQPQQFQTQPQQIGLPQQQPVPSLQPFQPQPTSMMDTQQFNQPFNEFDPRRNPPQFPAGLPQPPKLDTDGFTPDISGLGQQTSALPIKQGTGGFTPPIADPIGLPQASPVKLGGGRLIPPKFIPGQTPDDLQTINQGSQPNLQQLLGTAFGGGDPFAGLVQETPRFEEQTQITPDQLLAPLGLPSQQTANTPQPVNRQLNLQQILQGIGLGGGAGNFGGFGSKFGVGRSRF